MRIWKRGLGLVAALAVVGAMLAGSAAAQNLPYPLASGVFSEGEIIVGNDDSHVIGTGDPTMDSVTVGSSGSQITQIRVYSQTITPAEVATVVCAEQTFTVTGLTTADKVVVNPAATGNATSMAQARVSAANTLALMFCNPTGGALTPGAGTYAIVAFRS